VAEKNVVIYNNATAYVSYYSTTVLASYNPDFKKPVFLLKKPNTTCFGFH